MRRCKVVGGIGEDSFQLGKFSCYCMVIKKMRWNMVAGLRDVSGVVDE